MDRSASRQRSFALINMADGPDMEVVIYAHLGVGIVTTVSLATATPLGLPLSAGAGVLAFAVLTACLFNRRGVWIAAILGTLLAAGYTGLLGWFFGHLGHAAWWPWLGAVGGAALGAGLAVPAYASFIRRTSTRPT